MKSMLPFLKDKIFGGKEVLSKTISVETVESEIAKELTKTQKKFKNIEDLKVISAYCQDSIVTVKDLVFLKKN